MNSTTRIVQQAWIMWTGARDGETDPTLVLLGGKAWWIREHSI